MWPRVLFVTDVGSVKLKPISCSLRELFDCQFVSESSLFISGTIMSYIAFRIQIEWNATCREENVLKISLISSHLISHLFLFAWHMRYQLFKLSYVSLWLFIERWFLVSCTLKWLTQTCLSCEFTGEWTASSVCSWCPYSNFGPSTSSSLWEARSRSSRCTCVSVSGNERYDMMRCCLEIERQTDVVYIVVV